MPLCALVFDGTTGPRFVTFGAMVVLLFLPGLSNLADLAYLF